VENRYESLKLASSEIGMGCADVKKKSSENQEKTLQSVRKRGRFRRKSHAEKKDCSLENRKQSGLGRGVNIKSTGCLLEGERVRQAHATGNNDQKN